MRQLHVMMGKPTVLKIYKRNMHVSTDRSANMIIIPGLWIAYTNGYRRVSDLLPPHLLQLEACWY